MKTNNTKVNRMLGALAVLLKDEDDKHINNIHAMINDDKDGYIFDFMGLAITLRRQVIG